MGTLLYYAMAVDPTILVALVSIADNQAKNNETTTQVIKHLLNYCVTHPDYTVRYKESDMVIRVHSAGPHLSESQNHSRSGGNLFLGPQNFDQS